MSFEKIKLGVGVSKFGEANLSFNRTVHTLSGTEKTEIVVNGIQSLTAIIDGIKELSKERNITKRKTLEHEEVMKKIDTDHEKEMKKLDNELQQINKEFELNYKQLEDSAQLIKEQAHIIKTLLYIIDRLINRIYDYEQQYGFDNQRAIIPDNQLHELSISLTSQLRLQR